jgi:hypothetical protein
VAEDKAGDKTVARIRALLAKAESTDSLDEQAALIAKAQELQAKHNIDAAKLQAAGGAPAEEIITVRIEIARPRQSGGKALMRLMFALATCNGATAVCNELAGIRATVIGYPSELRAVEMIFTSLCQQLDHATAHALRHHKPADVHGRQYRVSYMHGWVDTVVRRLKDARAAAVAQASREDAGAGPVSTALVLRSREEQIEARMHEIFPRLSTFRAAYRPEASGLHQGRRDGERAALGGDLDARPSRPALT